MFRDEASRVGESRQVTFCDTVTSHVDFTCADGTNNEMNSCIRSRIIKLTITLLYSRLVGKLKKFGKVMYFVNLSFDSSCSPALKILGVISLSLLLSMPLTLVFAFLGDLCCNRISDGYSKVGRCIVKNELNE